MNTESAIQAHLDQHPDDYFAREVLADLLEELGDPRAAGYRWLGQNQKKAWYYRGSVTWGFFDSDFPIGGLDNYPPEDRLSWRPSILPKPFAYGLHENHYKRTRKAAEDYFALYIYEIYKCPSPVTV